MNGLTPLQTFPDFSNWFLRRSQHRCIRTYVDAAAFYRSKRVQGHWRGALSTPWESGNVLEDRLAQSRQDWDGSLVKTDVILRRWQIGLGDLYGQPLASLTPRVFLLGFREKFVEEVCEDSVGQADWVFVLPSEQEACMNTNNFTHA